MAIMAERFTSDALDAALARWRDAGVISVDQANAIRELELRRPGSLASTGRSAITPSMLVTWIGGFLVLVASAIFVALGWEGMGEVQRFIWAALAVAMPWAAAWYVRRSRQPLAETAGAALLAIGTVALVLFGYTFYHLVGLWPEDGMGALARERRENLLWLTSSAVVAMVAAIFAFRLRIPSMLLLTGFFGWLAWTDALDTWYLRDEFRDPEPWVMSMYGVVLVLIGFVVVRRGLRRHAFWLFLSGLTATFLFLGIDSLGEPLGITGLTFLALSAVAIVLSVRTVYRIFLIYGALGLYSWVSALIVETFGGSRLVAFGLIVLGAVIVAAGLAWQRRSDRGHHVERPGLRSS